MQGNHMYKFMEPCRFIRGMHTGLTGKVLNYKRPMFGDDEFLVRIDNTNVEVWIGSWSITWIM